MSETIDICSRIQRKMISADRSGAPLPPDKGLCVGEDTSWWYPTPGMNKAQLVNQEQAIGMCRSCPERLQCLSYAMEWEAFGIWGGFTERQRDSLRKRWNITQRRTSLANSRMKSGYDFTIKTADRKWLDENGF